MTSSASPTAILTDDALLSIFEWIPALEWRFAKGWEGLRIILPVSQVCKRWRDLAVNHSPKLWRLHALMIPPSQRVAYDEESNGTFSCASGIVQADTRADAAQYFQTELVRRSQTLSLESGREWNVVDEYYPTPKQILSVLAYAHRLRSCTLKLRCVNIPRNGGSTVPIDDSVVEALTQCSFPALEELCVDITNNTPATYVLPNTIFPGGLKSLKELRLKMCWMDLKALQLRGPLESLSITIFMPPEDQTPGVQNFPNTFQTFLDILSAVHNLWHLSLIYFPLFTLPEPAVISSPLVTLNRLFYLDISLTLAEVEVFARQVSIPACQVIHIKVHLPGAVSDLACVATLVSRHFLPSCHGTQMTLFDCGERRMGCATQPNDDEVDVGDPEVYLQGASGYKFKIGLVPSTALGEDIGFIFPTFLSAWDSILDDVNALIVQQRRDTPSYICRAINGFISRGRKHRMRTVVCPKDLVGVLVGAGGASEEGVHVSEVLRKHQLGIVNYRVFWGFMDLFLWTLEAQTPRDTLYYWQLSCAIGLWDYSQLAGRPVTIMPGPPTLFDRALVDDCPYWSIRRQSETLKGRG
ncbi:hypothetical protein DFP72DRAFT_1119315 [Ephemerocybe angulata]|uniref:F-box domain-containing protein n=1 Tax=Ephemerocybe angulata TaxID=980116 RepID=A0A8H6H606_9AGAR|nr:hypothetical protein DFP72DRAFT_1119315 [Tulosesus angulatus]